MGVKMSEKKDDKKQRLVAMDLGGGGLLLATDIEDTNSPIRIPYAETKYGSPFGRPIRDDEREFASEREPIGKFIVFDMSWDVWDNWFSIDDAKTDKPDEELDRKIQRQLRHLKTRDEFRKLLEFERRDGWGLLVGQFSDATKESDLEEEVSANAKLVGLWAYEKKNVKVERKDKNEDSLRYGEPEIYRINRGRPRRTKVHWTRCFKFSTRTGDVSALDVINDDMVCHRNARWGLAQTIFRYGSGFPVIKVYGADVTRLTEMASEGHFSDILARTYILINDQMEVDFKGAQVSALNPAPYLQPMIENMSIGSGVPEPILRGAQAGALTGSEVNEREYFKTISRIQMTCEDLVRWVVDKLLVSGQVEGYNETNKVDVKSAFDKIKGKVFNAFDLDDPESEPELIDYEVVWKGGFEMSETQKAQLDVMTEQANNLRGGYMTVNEIRELNELEPLEDTDPRGQIIPGVYRDIMNPTFEEKGVTDRETGVTYIIKKLQES